MDEANRNYNVYSPLHASEHFSLETSESLEMHIFSGGSKLQIARSQLSDSGTYSCVASNLEGKAHKSYHLTIQGKYTQKKGLLETGFNKECYDILVLSSLYDISIVYV